MTVHKEPEEDLVILLRENIKHLLHEHVLIEMMTLWFSQLYNYCTFQSTMFEKYIGSRVLEELI